MEKYCINREAGDRMYFTVTEDGQPLRQRRYYFSEAFYAIANAEYYGLTGEQEYLDRALKAYNIYWDLWHQPLRQRRYYFSEAFYAIANAEYYGLTGEQEYLDRALKAYNIYWDLWHGAPDPTGLGAKTIPETRTGRAFGLPMIYLNVTSVFLRVDPSHKDLYEQRANACVEDIFKYHVHPELKCVLENVGPNGEARLNYTEGRFVNPGHDIEGVWFLLEHAKRTGDAELVANASSTPVTTSRVSGSCWSTPSAPATPNWWPRPRRSSTGPSPPAGTTNTADCCTSWMRWVCPPSPTSTT